jgi:hypothetical protein
MSLISAGFISLDSTFKLKKHGEDRSRIPGSYYYEWDVMKWFNGLHENWRVLCFQLPVLALSASALAMQSF